ncbi:lysine-rich coiled-coil protein 1 [Rhinophrynus dorsalis]
MAAEGAIIPQLVESITQSSPSATCSEPMAGGDTSSNAQSTIPCQQDTYLDEQTKKDLFTDTFCKVCNAVLQFESHRISHYEGKKHAQKVRLYFLKNELEEIAQKKNSVDRLEFQVDGVAALDKNKFCSLCNMVFSSPVVAQSHYLGKIHAKKLKQSAGDYIEWTPQTDQAFTAVSPLSSQPAAAPPATESSPSHVEKVIEQEVTTEQQSSTDNEIDLNDPNKYCKLCCASFNKPLVALQHYNGKKHARNEARRRMMEEMEGTGLPVESAVNDGKYVCPICSVTLTSIEMYQSHMQGNKHQIKENMVASLMKTTKKTYNSFQDELADYIKVQKARGLEPKTRFKQEKDLNDSGEYEEEEQESRPPAGNVNTKGNVPYKYFDHHSSPYPAYNASHPPDNRVPAWSPHWEKVPRSQNTEKGQYFEMQNTRHSSRTPSSQDSSDDLSSSGESGGSHRKDRKPKRKHRKESRHRDASRIRKEDESTERKKRKIEDPDSGKDEKQDFERVKKNETESVAVDKSKHRKEKKKKEELSVEKESKKHKKVKKEGDQRTEEEILWDESILGF